MALHSKSLILYNLEVNEFNSSLDFKADSSGPIIMATLRLGFYSLSALLVEVSRAMQEADPDNNYSATTDRTISGGLENRTTIETSGTYLDLLFFSGPRVASSIGPTLGFPVQDKTGALTYTGSASCGVVIIPSFAGYNWLDADFQPKAFGAVNISANGTKEAVVFQIQQFLQIEFKYETKSRVKTVWKPFIEWAIQQRLFDFTPEISSPDVFYSVTFEKTAGDGKGLGFKWSEMIPYFPDEFQTGSMMFRVDNQ